MRKYFGDRKFILLVLSIAIPIMLQNLVTTSVNLVDSLMVGQLGDAAIGGVSTVNRFFMILSSGIFGLVNAVGIFIAQYYGAKNEEKMKEAFRFSLISTYVVIIPFFLVALLYPQSILGFFTKDAVLIETGVQYLRFSCFTFLPLGISLSISGAMRCIGEAKFPLIVSIISVLTNTFFNYCLIFGNFGMPALGVVGAAIATLIARLLEMTILLVLLRFIEFPFKTRMNELFHVSGTLARQIALKAAPLCINELLWSGGNAMMLKFYGTRGGLVLSGNAISQTTTDIFYTLFSGMSIATTVMVSHQLGANQLEKAKENGYRMVGVSSMFALTFSSLMFAMSYVVPFLYSSASQEVLNIAQTMIRVQSIFFVVYTLNVQTFFILRSGGDAKSTLILDSGFMWLFTIPVLGLISYFTNINIYLMYALGQSSEFVKLILSATLLKREKWVVNLTDHK